MCPDCHTFLCKFWHFQMAVSQWKLAWLTPNLGILWISVSSFWLCESIVANPIIYRLVPRPSRFETRQLWCFAHCGVDFAGPFVIKLTRKVTAKRYQCLFTCASTRAIHLEIAYSLGTASFLNTFSRMVARCGKPEVMISDNGTNFTSAERELRDLVSTLDQTRIKEQVTHSGIQWRFNPPGGSHRGGIFDQVC